MELKKMVPLVIYDNECYICVQFAKFVNFLTKGRLRLVGHYTDFGKQIRDSFLDSSVIEGDPEEPHTKPNTLLESGLAELFGNDPYSKIFPYIRNSQHFLDMTSQNIGFGEQFI